MTFTSMCFKAGKEGQISNQFKDDLLKIIDFLKVNRFEINRILKECPEFE